MSRLFLGMLVVAAVSAGVQPWRAFDRPARGTQLATNWHSPSAMEIDVGKKGLLVRTWRENLPDVLRALNEIRLERGLPVRVR